MDWSYTKLSTFLQCPKKYEFMYVKGSRFISNEPIALGNAWGKGLEVYSKTFSQRKAWDAIEQGLTSYLIKNKALAREQLLALFKLYTDKFALKPMFYNGVPMVEYPFKFYTPGGHKFSGRIDIVTMRRAVVDFKTAEKPYDKKYCTDPLSGKGLQLTPYAKAYFDIFKMMPLATGWNVAIKPEMRIENIVLQITQDHVNKFITLVDDTSKKVQNTITFEKVPQTLCAYCDFWSKCYGTTENRDRIIREARIRTEPTGSTF